MNEPHAAEMVPYALQGIYPSFPLSTCVSFAPTRTVSLRPITPSWLDHLHQLIRKSSLQNPMNKESWGFLHRFPGNSSMTWSHTLSEGRQDIQLRVDTFENGTGAPSTLTSLFLSVWMGAYPWNLSLRFLGYLGFGFLLIGMGYIILRYMISRIYALPSFYHRSHEVGGFHQVHSGQTLRHLLVLGPPGSGKSHLIQGLAPDCAVLDLHATYGKEIWADSLLQTIPTGTRAVIVDHFEYQWDIQTHQREKGKLIECLLSHHYQVCILSTRDPLEWTKLPWPDALNTTPDSTQAYWVDLLGSFGFIHFVPSRIETLFRQWLQPQSEPSGSTGTGSTLPVKHWLQQESQPSLQLERIGQWIRSFQEWATWTPGQMKEQFLRIGWPYYQALWQSCSLSEKLSLYHLAQDGYLHADNPDLTSLSQKGLIHLVPDLQLMNDSFRLFVLQIGTNLQIAHWEKQTHQDTWSKLKGPFLLIFGAILLFFFFTQQEFKSSFITLISLLPILLPALPELPFLFSSQKHVPPQS